MPYEAKAMYERWNHAKRGLCMQKRGLAYGKMRRLVSGIEVNGGWM